MSHQAGHRTDQIIAERLRVVLIRLAQQQVPEAAMRVAHPEAIPKYTTDLTAAWQLVEYLSALGYEFAVMTTPKERALLGRWTCAVTKGSLDVKSAATTAPLAISRAMLAVLTELERG